MAKRICALCLCVVTLVSIFSGCVKKENEKITVLCTIFPIYDWVRNVVGEKGNVEVKLLVSGGADLHSFQPTAKDAIAIRTADIVVRVGGADDAFVGELTEKGRGVDLRLMEAEGMVLHCVSSSSGHEHEHSHDHGHGHTTDEHIWLSVENAKASCRAICGALSELDTEGAEEYLENTEKYAEKLTALDAKYRAAVLGSGIPRLVVADRFPFVYMTEDYGIEYEAAFEGCTTDAEAGFDTVLRLASRVDEWKVGCLLVTESSDRRLADTVAEHTSAGALRILTLDSMQSVTEEDISLGVSYIEIMENNLAVLSEAISAGGTKGE